MNTKAQIQYLVVILLVLLVLFLIYLGFFSK